MLGCTGNYGDQDAGTCASFLRRSHNRIEADERNVDANTTEQDLYIHGYVSGRVFKKGKEAEDEGIPITVAATFLDGLVLSLTPFHNSCNYRSAVVYGYASIVSDPQEALYAMKLITNNLLPERWEKSRIPPSDAELKSTSILRVRISSGPASPFPFPIRVSPSLTWCSECKNPRRRTE